MIIKGFGTKFIKENYGKVLWTYLFHYKFLYTIVYSRISAGFDINFGWLFFNQPGLSPVSGVTEEIDFEEEKIDLGDLSQHEVKNEK